jgi:hypothetical protein
MYLANAMKFSDRIYFTMAEGLSGAFFIGQLAQLRACPLILRLEFGKKYMDY